MSVRKKRTLPTVGSCYERRYKGTMYRLIVVKDGSSVGYKLGNKVFASPSGAARSLTNNEVNGWVFWRINTDDE